MYMSVDHASIAAVSRHHFWYVAVALQEIIASFSFQAKVNLSAIKRIYSSLLWHFEQVGDELS
jgi:hypothetical protein